MDAGPEPGRVTNVLLFVTPFLAAAVAIGVYCAWRVRIAPPLANHGGCYPF